MGGGGEARDFSTSLHRGRSGAGEQTGSVQKEDEGPGPGTGNSRPPHISVL